MFRIKVPVNKSLQTREQFRLRLRPGAYSQFNSLPDTARPGCPQSSNRPRGDAMSKGLNQKKDAKKKPTKNLKEKRAEKQAKRGK